LEVLKKKHQVLSDEVETLQRSLVPDTLQLQRLKKRKLLLKQEIETKTVQAAAADQSVAVE
jgi:hypothetical protein